VTSIKPVPELEPVLVVNVVVLVGGPITFDVALFVVEVDVPDTAAETRDSVPSPCIPATKLSFNLVLYPRYRSPIAPHGLPLERFKPPSVEEVLVNVDAPVPPDAGVNDVDDVVELPAPTILLDSPPAPIDAPA
jgi:hypothetical protein